MDRTIRARFSHGVIEPMERVELPEGKELTITISGKPAKDEKQIDKQWGDLAINSFASDWENEKDALYDDWRERYDV